MSIRGLKKWALLLTFWVALQGKLLRATPITGDTVTGDFTATGNADVQGDTFSFGTRTDNSNPGWLTFYTDGTTSSLEFDASRSANVWKWQQNGGATLKLQMTLDNNNALTLFDQSSTPAAKITLNPLGTSTFAGSVTLNGTDNQMPNQTLTGSGSVITEGLGDSRYLFSSATSLVIGSNSSATGTNAVALGYHVSASGAYSFAEGYYSIASGLASTALGDAHASGSGSMATDVSTASGPGCVAMGASTASCYFSMAVGRSANASGYAAMAMGYGTTASGYTSMAVGHGTSAQAYNSVALGRFNVGGGTTSSWVTTDPLFEVGNGTDSNHLSDALVVYKNGNTTINGSLSLNGASLPAGVALGINPGVISDQNLPVQINGTVGANLNYLGVNQPGNNGQYGLLLGYDKTAFGNGAVIRNVASTPMAFVVNNTTVAETMLSNGNIGIGTTNPQAKLHVAGNSQVDGNVTAHGTIRCSPGGDLAMGSFTAGTAP